VKISIQKLEDADIEGFVKNAQYNQWRARFDECKMLIIHFLYIWYTFRFHQSFASKRLSED
jgi:hypothetical protein